MPPESLDRIREAGHLVQQVTTSPRHRVSALVRLRGLYPEAQWYYDDNYGLSILVLTRPSVRVSSHLERDPLPKVVKHHASHILRAEPGEVVVVKDRTGRLAEKTEVTRLFQVITGLVPDGFWGPHTQNRLEELVGPVSSIRRPSRWERILADDA